MGLKSFSIEVLEEAIAQVYGVGHQGEDPPFNANDAFQATLDGIKKDVESQYKRQNKTTLVDKLVEFEDVPAIAAKTAELQALIDQEEG